MPDGPLCLHLDVFDPASLRPSVRRTSTMPKPIIDTLLDNAYQDTQVLVVNEKERDQFSVARDVQFILRTDDKTKAETVRSFITDNQYADSVTIVPAEEHSELRVTVHMLLP